MEAHHVLILAGLAVEIVGVFILAAEAIGIERLEFWTASLSRTRAEMAGAEVRKGSTFLDPNRFIAAFGAAGGGAFAIWASSMMQSWPSALAQAGGFAVAALAGGIFGVALYRGALVTLRVGASALRRLEARVRVRAVGVLGFGLLFLGFLLQFAGTLVDALESVVR